MALTKSYAVRENRFWLVFSHPDLFELRQLEGIRFHRDLQAWSLPASLRAINQLEALGFAPKDGGTVEYRNALAYLAGGLPESAAVPPLSIAGYELMPFQQVGLDFLRARDNVLLYDEQGLGKTLQALAWAEKDPALAVVAPKSVLFQWADYMAAMGKDPLIQPSGKLGPRDWAVTNYERASRFELARGATLLVDECQYIKNPRSARSKLVLAMSRQASRIMAISGTPMVNRPVELWPVYMLLGERWPNEFWGFVKRYCAAYQGDFGWDFSGASHLDELKEDMLHFSLRRTKAEVLSQLPPKRYTTLRVAVSKEVRNEISEHDARIFGLVGSGVGLYGAEGLGALQRLRVVSANAKVEAAIQFISEYYGPIVVFSGFKEPLRQIVERCGGALYTGDESARERELNKQAFISGLVRVLCLTYGAGGVGLDGLQTCADTAVLLDLPWTPAEVSQAEDRLHRLGQSKSVHIIRLWAGSLVEEKILQALDRKLDILSYLMEV